MPKNEKVLDKKVKERLTKEIYQEINEDVKKDVASKAMLEVEELMDSEYKNSLKEKITLELIDDIKEDVKKEQKKMYRSKNFKIFRMYIYLILLLAASIFCIYQLYINGDLAILDKITTKKTTNVVQVTTTKEVKNLAWYMKNYGDILDNIHFTDAELVKNKYIIKDLNNQTKLAMTYMSINKEDIVVDGIINKITAESMATAYKKLFGTDLTTHENFNVDGINFAYSQNEDSYVAVIYNPSDKKIVNSIVNIEEKDGYLVVNAVVGLVVKDSLYNVNNTNNKIKDYVDGENISSLSDKLSKVEYRFTVVDGTYYLYSIN